jgi:hypothetical protein
MAMERGHHRGSEMAVADTRAGRDKRDGKCEGMTIGYDKVYDHRLTKSGGEERRRRRACERWKKSHNVTSGRTKQSVQVEKQWALTGRSGKKGKAKEEGKRCQDKRYDDHGQ